MRPSNVNFIPRIPMDLDPRSTPWKNFWRETKRRCIEGFWFEGVYMPGPLYFYVNLGRILMNVNKAKTKSVGQPLLRDIEWDKAYVYLEAKGFSGFEDDKDITCSWFVHEVLSCKDPVKKEALLLDYIIRQKITEQEVTNPTSFPLEPKLKAFENPRTYMKKQHSKNLGKAIYRNSAKNVIDIETRRIGKDLWWEEVVHTTGGKVKLKDIAIGDNIIDHNGKETKVISKVIYYDQLQYRVSLSDGRSVECGGGHLWTVWDHTNEPKLVTMELREILSKGYKFTRKDGNEEYKFKVPNHKPIEYGGEDPSIDPYYLGLWLGDGTSLDTGITTEDSEIKNYLFDLAEKLGLKVTTQCKKNNKSSTLSITCGIKGNNSHGKNTLLNELKKLDLIGNKHIPNIVYTASVDYRKKVVEGLIDSDGWCSSPGAYEVCSSYLGLSSTLGRLFRELGIIYRTSVKKTKGKPSVKFRLLTDTVSCKLERKNKGTSVSTFAKRQRDRISIVDITPTEIKPSVCIGVDNKDSLFLVGECIVTHNSMFAGNALINHNFLFDGATDYDVYLDAKNNGKPLSSETLVGAIDSKYTKDLLSKCEVGLSNLPGSKVVNDIYFPSPLSKLTTGTFAAGKYMEASFKVKQVGGWTVKGSRSKIHNRSFADNPLAGNGTGPNLVVLEEVGFMTNLIDTLGALKDATYEGLDKFGVIFMSGTGGEMDAAAVSQTKEVFFNPAAYDCLEFENIWSNGSEKIGYFVPYHKRLDEYRDNEGVLDVVRAKKAVADKREEIKKSGKQRAFYSEIQNNPEAPEEAFMVDNANLFPTAELKEHLGWLQSKQQDVDIRGQYGELVFTPDAGGAVTLNWKPDLKKVLEPCGFRMRPSDNTKGCIVIWEHPVKQNGHIPYGLYIAGTDPYDQDQAESSVSLGSTFIYKTFQTLEGVYEWPVAEYTARPGSAEEHHENVRKLLMYYNAIDLYENERNTLKMHFSHKHSLHLLAKTPTILKATENSKVNRGYGIHMNMYIKDEIEIYTRDWLQTDIGDGRLNLHKIMSIPLLQELIDYNKTGNFDRVIAFMLCILHRLQNHHIKVADAKQKTMGERDSFFSRSNKFFK